MIFFQICQLALNKFVQKLKIQDYRGGSITLAWNFVHFAVFDRPAIRSVLENSDKFLMISILIFPK